MHSVKKMSEKLNKGFPLAHHAFTTIRYAVLHANSKEEVTALFSVLCDEKPIDTAIAYIPQSEVLKEYQPHHSPNKWEASAHWCKWWIRPSHLRIMLMYAY